LLYDLYQKYGGVSPGMFYKSGLPSVQTYKKRFGSLEDALLLSQKGIVEKAKEIALDKLKRTYRVKKWNGSYLLEKKIQLGIKVSFPMLKGNDVCWVFHLKKERDDFTLGLGLGTDQTTQELKYFLFPNMLMEKTIKIPVEESGLYKIYEYKQLNIF